MEEVLNVNNIVGGTSENAKMILKNLRDSQQGMGILIAAVVVGILLCLFGLKLVRVLTAIVGFGIGIIVGTVASGLLELRGMTMVIVIFACAVILASLAFFLDRVGVFFVVLNMAFSVALSFIDSISIIALVIALFVSVVLAVLAVIHVEPIVVIVTAAAGGILAGSAIAQLAGLDDNILIGYGIGIILAVIGMVVQFMMQSRKVGKKEKIHSEKVKKKVSVESEVEKARMILDEVDEDDDFDKDMDDDKIR